MDDHEKRIFYQLKQIAKAHDLRCRATYGMSGGAGWINYRRDDDNDYSIQISTPTDYSDYKEIKDAICAVFGGVGAVLASEDDYGSRLIGYQRELKFIDKEKFEKSQQKENSSPVTNNIGTQINGDISTSSGNINTGNTIIIDSKISQNEPDQKWFQKEVVKMILSFISGVAATLVAQWIMQAIGWM